MDKELAHDPTPNDDIGFSYRIRKSGDVVILHHGTLAATLRGAVARTFVTNIQDCNERETQHLMARLTGNYRRGNERQAGNHPRNRG